MRRMSLYIGILLLTFVCGVVTTSLMHQYFLQGDRTTVETKVLLSNIVPRFIPVGSLLEPDYHIYWYRTPASTDPEEITLYGDFRSGREAWLEETQVTREHFESNATTKAAKLVESGSKFDVIGQKIGRRGVTVFTINQDVHAVRIFWTEGDIFWSVQAPSLELAREFEESEIVHSITMSNKRLQRTAR